MDGNHLYYGNNIDVLRQQIGDESVDLVYLDPPFNSQATYNVLFRSPAGQQSQAQIEAFEDTWHWGDEVEAAFDEVMRGPNADAAEMLRAMRSFLRENDMMAYLTMMAVRLIELHRVLKPTGSLYLHCDPTASHYLRSCWTLSSVCTALSTRLCGREQHRRGLLPLASLARMTSYSCIEKASAILGIQFILIIGQDTLKSITRILTAQRIDGSKQLLCLIQTTIGQI